MTSQANTKKARALAAMITSSLSHHHSSELHQPTRGRHCQSIGSLARRPPLTPRRSLQLRRRSTVDHRPAYDAMGRKRAVLVGINYPGTEGELKGCLNDVGRMRRCLVDRFGFDEADIRVLADADPSTPQPTGANIRRELERLVGDARPGDSLFFHYSGHGLQLPVETGAEDDDDTGYDECIVPCDMNLIKGDLIVTKISRSSCRKFPMAACSPWCPTRARRPHRQDQGADREQYEAEQDSATGQRIAASSRPRHVLMCLSSADRPAESPSPSPRDRTGKDDVCVGSIRTTLFHHFGDDASPKIRRLVRAMLRHKHGGGGGGVGSGATAGEEHQDNAKPERDGEGEATKQDAPAARASPRNGVLISGCQTDETSADATTPEGVSYGALSNAIQNVLAAVHRGKVINMELVRRTRELLAKQGYTQQPGLYCSDKHANVAFIC
uniref:Peptidase C14 caspase domain-containing protein n=1 Tax=Oryza brachyantha TaxID=4533 RepID=J3M8I0_ORYBR